MPDTTEDLRMRLAAALAREEKLRAVLSLYAQKENVGGLAGFILDSIPPDETALDDYLRLNGWRRCAQGQRTTQYCGLTEQAANEKCRGLRDAIVQALEENGHLADGVSCSLIMLKQALREYGTLWEQDDD